MRVQFAPNNHWHETVEEIFYIISGEGIVRSVKGDVSVKAGDVICFPTGEGGSHVIRNSSAMEKLVYLDFGTRGECEIAHLIDAQKILVIGKSGMGVYDEPEGMKWRSETTKKRAKPCKTNVLQGFFNGGQLRYNNFKANHHGCHARII